MTNLEIIREKVIAANPEIMELKFGCQIYKPNGDIATVARVYSKGRKILFAEATRFDVHDMDLEVIGRPIRLDDCRKIIKEDFWGELIELWRDGYLEDQPEEVVNWLHENKN